MIRHLIPFFFSVVLGCASAVAEVPSLINYQGKIAVSGVNFNGTGQFKFALVSGGSNLSQTATASATVYEGFVVGGTVTSGGSGYQTAPAITISGNGSGATARTTISGGAVTAIQVLNAGSGYTGQVTFTIAAPMSNVVNQTYWSNDGSSAGGSQPSLATSLTVNAGIYSVLLGDTQISNMQAIPAATFKNNDVRLRVWFSDGVNGYQLMTPDQRISAVGYAMMAANVPDAAITSAQLASGAVVSSKISSGAVGATQMADGAVTSGKIATGAVGAAQINDGAVTSDKIASGAIATASAREGNLVLSPTTRPDLEQQGFIQIGLVNNTSLLVNNAPSLPTARSGHTAVWTGSEMIVWGGQGSSFYPSGRTPILVNTGDRYNPTTNTWSAVSTMGAPDPRMDHSAVWTGIEMIVWGGQGSSMPSDGLTSGGRYNPTSNTWVTTSPTAAPDALTGQSVVWTGSEMIVWGGQSSSGLFFNTGARYNPTSDNWSAISTTGAPDARTGQSAVWTGSQMIVWGGQFYDNAAQQQVNPNTGGRYNPTNNTWSAISTTSAPDGRYSHAAVWTGSQMVVWGGQGSSGALNTGGRYSPTSNAWSAISTTDAPGPLNNPIAVWSSNEMIVFGTDSSSSLTAGGRYNPTSDTWAAISLANAPNALSSHTAVWTDSEMIVWGGEISSMSGAVNTGGRYNPTSNTWMATPTSVPPDARYSHTAVWTGSEMIVWGGSRPSSDGMMSSVCLNTGGRYNPATNSWIATSVTGAPDARYGHTAVWTGKEMIVWGGQSSLMSDNGLNTGGRYSPTSNTWTATSSMGAPDGRVSHTAVFTGSEMIVWGGKSASNTGSGMNTGGRYNSTSDTWTSVATTSAPDGRYSHTAVWTDSEMIIFGGVFYSMSGAGNTGARYNPATDTWTPTPATGAPDARYSHTAVWTGSEMIVWGGCWGSNYDSQFINNQINTGGRYNPTSNTWTAISMVGAPDARAFHTAVWTGSEMIVWGGRYRLPYSNLSVINTGSRYNLSDNLWQPLTIAVQSVAGPSGAISIKSLGTQPLPRSNHSAVWTGSQMILFGGACSNLSNSMSNGAPNYISDNSTEVITPKTCSIYSKP